MSFLIISGISGSGKSLVSNYLEDMGFFCIDNLPPQLLLPVSKLQTDSPSARKLAVVIDSRSQEMFETLDNELNQLDSQGIEYKLVFIYTEPEVILNRYKQTRRKHPLANSTATLQDAIDKEYILCKPIQARADLEIDTTHLKNQQLRKTIIDMFKEDEFEGLTVKLISFGYRNGVPNEADLVFDVRCLPNPFYIEELRNHDGMEDVVYDYVMSFPQSQQMGTKIADFLKTFLPYYENEGKSELVVGIGCTSGHHRSVTMARDIRKRMQGSNYRILMVNRDIDKDF